MRIASRAIPISALAAVGCLTVPGPERKQCAKTADCETALGEICDDGVCWGGPPSGAFGIMIAPPSDRDDLTTAEREIDMLPSDGQLGRLQLDAPVSLSGRVEAFCVAPMMCPGNSIAATVTITRPPLFRGGPGFKTIVMSRDNVPRGQPSFSVLVPQTRDGDPDYVITIVPEGDGNRDQPLAAGTVSAAELAPPMRSSIAAPTALDLGTLVLGNASSAVLSGNLTDAGSHTLTNYRVVALGRLDPNGPVTEVSTVDYSSTGAFSLVIADGAIAPLTIEAQPYDPTLPTLYVDGLDTQSSSHTIVQPANLGNTVALALAIEGLSGDGQVKPVSGAHVTATSLYAQPFGGALRAISAADATTGPDGAIQIELRDGTAFASSYKLRVVPPAGSELGVVYDDALRLDRTATVRLPRRVAMRGRVVEGGGRPVGQMSVTARPSLRFLWSLDDAARSFVAAIPVASAVTTKDGDFVLWVDPYIAGTWGRYDLEFDAPSGSEVASWVRPDVEVPRMQQTSVAVGDVVIPESALIRGILTDSHKAAAVGADLAIYQIPIDNSLCQLVLFPPAICTIAARRLAKGTSDPGGVVRLALPR